MNPLHDLAQAAGIARIWRDVFGQEQLVSDDSLRAVLAAIGLAAGSDAEIAASRAALHQESSRKLPPLVTADAGRPVHFVGKPKQFRLTLESGRVIEGMADEAPDGGAVLPAVQEPGYHRLEFGSAETILAVAPPRAYTLEDAAAGAKIWGLTVQLYGLRRARGGSIGDFAALAEFCAEAAKAGADAVAISPIHALFSADEHRFSPYAPSNRAAFNVLHIAAELPDSPSALIDWPAAAREKFLRLRAEFERDHDHAALAAYRARAGQGIERHAIFEALSETLSERNPAALDWRNWPEAFRHPDNPAVARFVEENERKIAFHLWLQMHAEAGLEAAQKAARAGGSRIGLITDLAVGTDHSGSASWSRPEEVLRGLEIGAPPDLINREGQSWGITAFSPRGLRVSGFAGYIEMLRHALKHAGGVRIDHVMGLNRLWVIPAGFSSAEGAYLSMPAEELMRLTRLESQRHQAVILGEDLGTLPPGYGERLGRSGIAGLRVMWFEADGPEFRPPARWSPTAVAMTTTHDLPTVAGWWEGNDIAWREKLGMAGETPGERARARKALWHAFQQSGAASGPPPPDHDGAAVTYVAANHLGRAASTLALLPIEDALSLPEQPNLPGTTDQHPNWRRRLPADARDIFSREEVEARLAALAAARQSS